MPRQSNGTYVAPANTAGVSGNTISPSAYNTLETDIGTEITNSVDRAGRSAMTAALPMGGNKITGLADPVALTDASTKNYVLQSEQQAVAQSYANTGSADALTCACTPTVTALTNGMTFFIRAAAANATTTPTFAPDAIAAAVIVKGAGAALAAGDIAGAGYWASITYDATLTKWVLNNPATGITAAPASLGFFKNLSIKVASNTTVNVVADSVVTTNGSTFQATAVNCTINLGTNGAANALDAGTIAVNTWYALFVIAKPDGTTAGLASTSGTSPTLPTGYTYKARVGWVRTINASATLYGTWQLGRDAQYVVGLAQTATIVQMSVNGSAGNPATPTYVAVPVSNFVPSTASKIKMSAQTANSSNAQVIVSPNNSYGALNSTTNPPYFQQETASIASGSSTPTLSPFEMILESTNIYWASANGGNNAIYCLGWTDNV